MVVPVSISALATLIVGMLKTEACFSEFILFYSCSVFILNWR